MSFSSWRRLLLTVSLACLSVATLMFWLERPAPALSHGGDQTTLPNGDAVFNSGYLHFPTSLPVSMRPYAGCLMCHGLNPNIGVPPITGLTLPSTTPGYVAATLLPFSSAAAWGGHPASALVDTDGDGFTNGEELQDPAGQWGYNAVTTTVGDQAFVSNPNWDQAYPRAPIIVATVGITNNQLISGQVPISVALRYAGLSQVVYAFTSASQSRVFTVTAPSPTNYAAAFCLGYTTAAPGACSLWNSTNVPDGVYTVTVTAYDRRVARLGGPQTATFRLTQVTIFNAGAPPAVALAPASLTFGPQLTSSTSSAKVITVTNTGGAPLTVASLSASGPFSVAGNTCLGAPVGGNQSCTVRVAFSPVVSGTVTGTLSIASNAASSPDEVALLGLGLSPVPPVVSLSSPSLKFGWQLTGTTSLPQALVLTNTGGLTLTLVSLSVSKPFTLTSNTCAGARLLGTQSCVMQVAFAPVVSATVTGALTLTTNAASSPDVVQLSGKGTAVLPPIAALSAASLAFGPQAVNTLSAARAVVITNTGGSPLTLTGLTLTGDFALQAGAICLGVSLPPQQTCQMLVTFFPLAGGTRSGMLTIASNADTSPDLIRLSGTGMGAVYLPLVLR